MTDRNGSGGDADAAANSGDAAGVGVPLADFDRVCERLRAWCSGGGEFRVETRQGVEWAVCDFGHASLAVAADGRVDGGMPLHGFEGRAERLAVEDDAVRLLAPDVEYVYRRP